MPRYHPKQSTPHLVASTEPKHLLKLCIDCTRLCHILLGYRVTLLQRTWKGIISTLLSMLVPWSTTSKWVLLRHKIYTLRYAAYSTSV